MTLLVFSFDLYSQIENEKPVPFLHSKNTNISFGPIYGLHPNLRNEYPKMYAFVEGNTSFNVRNIPLKMSFRYSDEQLKFGKANYFRLSLDVQTLQKMNCNSYKEQAEYCLKQLIGENQYLKELEGKLSFIRQKQKELKTKNEYQNQYSLDQNNIHDSLRLFSYKGLNDIDTSFEFKNNVKIGNAYSIPEYDKLELDEKDLNINYAKNQDSLLNLENDYLNSINNSKDKINALEHNYEESLSKYKSVQDKSGGLDFLSGIKKFDIGLTSMNNSSFSSNSLPIKGVRFIYEDEMYFIDFSAGFTLPNQLISNKIFDQVAYNSENVINSSSFFQVKSTRFISNAIIGYGKMSGNYLAIENYYAGKLLVIDDSKKSSTDRTITTNLTGNTKIGVVKGLTWKNTVGLTWYKEDSLYNTKNIQDKVGYSSRLNYELKRSSVQVNYRFISKEYDGWVQGIYLKQTDRLEVLMKQTLGANIRAVYRVAKNRYAVESVFGRRQTNEAGLDVNLKINSRIYLSSSYTLLQLAERNSQNLSSKHLSHLGRLILTSSKSGKSFSFVTNHELGMLSMQIIDTNQQMLNAVTGYRFNKNDYGLGLQLNYSKYIGFNQIAGQSLIIQPELSYRLKSFYLNVNGQYLISQQYGNVLGGKILLGFSFDKYVDVNFIFQKYLPTDFLFYQVVDELRKPIYFKMSLNIHLFSPRKR